MKSLLINVERIHTIVDRVYFPTAFERLIEEDVVEIPLGKTEGRVYPCFPDE